MRLAHLQPRDELSKVLRREAPRQLLLIARGARRHDRLRDSDLGLSPAARDGGRAERRQDGRLRDSHSTRGEKRSCSHPPRYDSLRDAGGHSRARKAGVR